DHLAVAPGADQARVAQLGEVLRKGRLAELHAFGDCAHRQLLLDQVAHDRETLAIAKQGKDPRDFVRSINKLRRWHYTPARASLPRTIAVGASATVRITPRSLSLRVQVVSGPELSFKSQLIAPDYATEGGGALRRRRPLAAISIRTVRMSDADAKGFGKKTRRPSSPQTRSMPSASRPVISQSPSGAFAKARA